MSYSVTDKPVEYCVLEKSYCSSQEIERRK